MGFHRPDIFILCLLFILYTLPLSVLLSRPFPLTTTLTQMTLSSPFPNHYTLTQAFLTFKKLLNRIFLDNC